MAKEGKDEKKELTVTFEYKILPSYNVYSVDGVYGGMNAHGDIVINFFQERTPIPKTQTFKIYENGSLSEMPISQEGKSNIIRNVLLGIATNPGTARSIAQWLVQKADEYDRIVKIQTESGSENE